MSIAAEMKALRTPKSARILQIDIETSPNLAYVWGIWDQNISLSQLIEPSEVMCFAAKWFGDSDDEIIFSSSYHNGFKQMILTAHELYEEADVVVTYNGKNFDNKHLLREMILQGLTPPSPWKDIDLLSVVRSRFKFQSNKLDFVAEQLGLGNKVKHSGFQLWRDCVAGEGDVKKQAWEDMKNYNLGDVILQEKVYQRLLPWIKNHPVVSPVDDNSLVCPRCGSFDLTPEGTHSPSLLTYERLRCNVCTGLVQNTKSVGRVSNVRAI